MQKKAGIAKRLIVLAIGVVMLVGTVTSAAAAGVDTTTLDLDRYGADVVPAGGANPASVSAYRGPDITTLYLDRDGADIPTGTWWGVSNYAGGADAHHGPDTTDLNLDRDGADIANR